MKFDTIMRMIFKVALSLFLAATYVGRFALYSPDDEIRRVLLLHFQHLNVYHLLSNLICLYALRTDIVPMCLAYLIAVGAAIVSVSEPTIGFSGVIFAFIGLHYGRYGYHKSMCTAMLFAYTTGMLPHIAMMFHFTSLLIGYASGRLYDQINGCQRTL